MLPTSPATLLSTSSDKTCRLWDLSALEKHEGPPTIQTIKEHTRPVDSAAYWTSETAPQGKFTVWTSDSLGVIKRWSMERVSRNAKRGLTPGCPGRTVAHDFR